MQHAGVEKITSQATKDDIGPSIPNDEGMDLKKQDSVKTPTRHTGRIGVRSTTVIVV